MVRYLIGPPIGTHAPPISLAPLSLPRPSDSLPPPPPPRSHWSPISLVPQCNHGHTVLIGPPSHWSPNVTLVIKFSLVPHLIGPPM